MRRIVTLLALALIIGLVLVHLRTLHRQRIYQLTSLSEQAQHLRQTIWSQQAKLSVMTQRPQRVMQKIEHLNLGLYQPGVNSPEGEGTKAAGFAGESRAGEQVNR